MLNRVFFPSHFFEPVPAAVVSLETDRDGGNLLNPFRPHPSLQEPQRFSPPLPIAMERLPRFFMDGARNTSRLEQNHSSSHASHPRDEYPTMAQRIRRPAPTQSDADRVFGDTTNPVTPPSPGIQPAHLCSPQLLCRGSRASSNRMKPALEQRPPHEIQAINHVVPPPKPSRSDHQ